MKLIWTRPASTDRKEIREYIAQNNPAAALALDAQISKHASHLTDHPQLGRPGRITGTRELVVHQNYVLIYDTDGDLVRVLRMLHAAKQWPPREED